MHADAQDVRGGKPVVLTNSLEGTGIDELVAVLEGFRAGGQ